MTRYHGWNGARAVDADPVGAWIDDGGLRVGWPGGWSRVREWAGGSNSGERAGNRG
ncbi:MAG: hypothetical protein ACHQ7M_18005 [Chloroflexota bacterium]